MGKEEEKKKGVSIKFKGESLSKLIQLRGLREREIGEVTPLARIAKDAIDQMWDREKEKIGVGKGNEKRRK